MLERVEFNMFVRASFNPRNFYCTKNELNVRKSYINNALLSNSLSVSVSLSLCLCLCLSVSVSLSLSISLYLSFYLSFFLWVAC